MALIQTGFSRSGSVGRLLIGYSIIICRTFSGAFASPRLIRDNMK